tara:strand:+ start:1323 stop:1883 length:561 start_codon:yes stop_codon:yes gene_type:complete
MSNILFLDTARVKRDTPIQGNVEDSVVIPYIIMSQDTHIQQLTGTTLYKKLLADIAAESLTGNYKDLVDDYLIPCLVQWTFYEVLPFINFKITNKSIVKGTSEYSSEIDLGELKYIRNATRDMAEFYSNRLRGYLKEYSNLFPEYLTNNGLDKLQPKKRATFFGGVYTGRANDSHNYGLGISTKII